MQIITRMIIMQGELTLPEQILDPVMTTFNQLIGNIKQLKLVMTDEESFRLEKLKFGLKNGLTIRPNMALDITFRTIRPEFFLMTRQK